MKPLATKLSDAREQIFQSNLCNEIPIGPILGCTLRVPCMFDTFVQLSLTQQYQIKMELVNNRGGGKDGKIIQAYPFGATQDELLPYSQVVAITDALIKDHGGTITEVTDTVSGLISTYITTSLETLTSLATMRVMKEKGLMPRTTALFDHYLDQESINSAEYKNLINTLRNPANATKEDIQVNDQLIGTNEGESKNTEELMQLVSAATDADKTQVEGGVKLISADFDGDQHRKIKRKKSKPKSKHLPNMKQKGVRRLMGATILNMLGKVQQDTQDSMKRALLKELPAADIIESATGEQLPDYQANLINGFQAKADPTAPVVERMNREIWGADVGHEVLPVEPAPGLKDKLVEAEYKGE